MDFKALVSGNADPVAVVQNAAALQHAYDTDCFLLLQQFSPVAHREDYDRFAEQFARVQTSYGMNPGWRCGDGLNEMPYEPVNNPQRLARAFRINHLQLALEGVAHYHGEWYVFNGGWEHIENFKHEVTKFCNDYFKTNCYTGSVSANLVGNVMLNIEAYCERNPGWQHLKRPDALAFNNCLCTGREQFEPNTPDFFSPSTIPHDLRYTRDEPSELLKMFDTSGVRPEEVRELQKFAGLCLTPEMKYQKMLYFKGKPRSGKGNYMRLLTWILGNDNFASKNLSEFGDKNALGDLPGKLLCVFSDEHGTQYANETALMNVLKISGGDPVNCKDKYIRQSTEWLTTKFAIFSNGKLFIEDEHRAGLSRILAIQSRISHAGREDKTLEDRIREQKNEVLSWMLRGLWLLEDEGFIQPENELIAEYKIVNSPIATFLEDRCVFDGEVCKKQLFAEYKKWSEDHNRQPSESKFYEHMAPFSGARRAFGRVYEGISLRGVEHESN